jgi:hypothetical protein
MYIRTLVYRLLRHSYSRYRGIKKYAKIIPVFSFFLDNSLHILARVLVS